MATQLHSVRIAEQLTALAELVGGITFLHSSNHVNLSAPRDEDDGGEIDVHDCTPDQLTQAQLVFPRAEPRYDADEILRSVTAQLGGAELTFYRR